MSFDKEGWVDDMITRALAGALAGVAGAALVPEPAYGFAAVVGGVSGLAFGLVALPISTFLKRLRDRRRPTEKESES